MSKKNSFFNELIASVRTPGATWMWIAIAFMIVIEGFAGGWVLDVPHVLIYIGYGVVITAYAMDLRTQSLLREKEQEIKKLREDHEDYDELRLHSQALWALDSQMLPYIQSAVSTPRDLAKGHGLNTVLQIVARMLYEVHAQAEQPGKLVRTEGNVGRVYLAEFLEELDRVAPPRIRR